MKKRVIIAIIFMTTLIAMVSCVDTPIDNYGGCIIHKKEESGLNGRKSFILQKENTKRKGYYYFVEVYVSDHDYNRYNVKDTIR